MCPVQVVTYVSGRSLYSFKNNNLLVIAFTRRLLRRQPREYTLADIGIMDSEDLRALQSSDCVDPELLVAISREPARTRRTRRSAIT
jgi:hypothetical protein